MDIVRLYYSRMDIKPRILLHLCLRYMGIYIEEVTEDTQEGELAAFADIYIVSEMFVSERGKLSLNIEEEKTILILMDGWNVGEGSKKFRTVSYNRGVSDRDFLHSFLGALEAVMAQYATMPGSLLFSGDEVDGVMERIAEAFLENQIMPHVLYTKCFYENEVLYREAIGHYDSFIASLECLARKSALARFALLYAEYERCLINRKNSYRYSSETDKILDGCQSLLLMYGQNSQIHLLLADAYLNLKDNWLQAAEEYAVPCLNGCAYSEYRRGRIMRKYLGDYESAALLLENVVRKVPGYFSAWYQLGLCWDKLGDYRKAINAFGRIYEILKKKLQGKLLAPIELEYLYKSFMKMAQIYRLQLDDYVSADVYNENAQRVKLAVRDKGYLDAVWEENTTEVADMIQAEMEEQLDIRLEQIC